MPGAEDMDAEIAKAQRERQGRVGLDSAAGKEFDSDIYGGTEKGGEGYSTELVDEADEAPVTSASAFVVRCLLFVVD